MDQEKKQIKCNIHQDKNQDFLLFEEDNIHAQICLSCAKKISNNLNKIMEIDEIIQANDSHIFSSFPPLEDKNIYEIMQNIQIKSSLKEVSIERIDQFFTSLKQEINQKIDEIKNQTKAKLIKMEDLNQFNVDQFIKDYNEVSSKFDIQNLYKQFKENSEQKLKDIIKEKYQNVKQNTQKLQKHINNYQNITNTNTSQLKHSNEIKQKILDLLDKIDFIIEDPNYSIENIGLEKSKSYRNSQSLAILRLENQQIQIQQTVDGHGVAYSNTILDPMKKYIFRVRLQSKSESDSFLFVGIIKEQNKDNSQLSNGISYNERGDSMTINKVIKGNNVHEGQKQNIDKEIEVRIHLAEKMIKVGNYPNYDNVAELQDKELIENNTQYRFAVEIFYQVQNMVITHFSQVNNFDNKM